MPSDRPVLGSSTFRPSAGPSLPSFLVIGAMRSGTTALARSLREHPEVFLSTPKEVHFFDWNWERGLEWYADHFAGAGDARALGEATPGYMYFRDALDRMATTCPEARLIAILRNPVDRAYSHYWFNRALKIEEVSFARALEREPERLTSRAVRQVFAYVDMGRYVDQLQAVCARYPRSALHVVLFEDLISDPFGVYSEISRFLGVDDGFRPAGLGSPVNEYAEFRSRGVQKVAASLPDPFRRGLRRLNRRRASYPPMDPGVRSGLEQTLSHDNERLARWLGRDLSVWDVH